MSNYLAIATVTEALKRQLQEAISKTELGEPVVFTKNPHDLKGDDPFSLNLFLYQVMPNAALRGLDVPTRNHGGHLVEGPALALDLHYLITASGKDATTSQILLGAAATYLHARPELSKKSINEAVSPENNKSTLVKSNLPKQAEPIRITPIPLQLEDLSKLWTVFSSAPYRLSVAYQVSPVILEPELPKKPAAGPPKIVRLKFQVGEEAAVKRAGKDPHSNAETLDYSLPKPELTADRQALTLTLNSKIKPDKKVRLLLFAGGPRNESVQFKLSPNPVPKEATKIWRFQIPSGGDPEIPEGTYCLGIEVNGNRTQLRHDDDAHTRPSITVGKDGNLVPAAQVPPKPRKEAASTN